MNVFEHITFHISHVRISQKVKVALMWNVQHIIFDMNTKILADFQICNIAALKLMKLLVYKIMTKQTALKNHPIQSPRKCFVL